MRANAAEPLHLDGVRQLAQQLEAPIGQAVERTDAVVVNTGLLGTVHGVEAPPEIALDRAGGMQARVGAAVISFLKHLEGSQPAFVQHLQLGHAHRRGIHVHAADLPHAAARGHPHRIHRANALRDVVHARFWMLTIDHDQPLVPEFAGQRFGFSTYFRHVQHAAFHGRVGAAQTAIDAVVDALAAHVERGKGHDTVIINLALDGPGRCAHFRPQLRIAHAHQRGQFGLAQRLHRQCFGDDLAHRAGLRLAGDGQEALNVGIVDEILPIRGQVFLDFRGDDPFP